MKRDSAALNIWGFHDGSTKLEVISVKSRAHYLAWFCIVSIKKLLNLTNIAVSNDSGSHFRHTNDIPRIGYPHSSFEMCLFLELLSQSSEDVGWLYAFQTKKLNNNALSNKTGASCSDIRLLTRKQCLSVLFPLRISLSNNSRGRLEVSTLRAQGQ